MPGTTTERFHLTDASGWRTLRWVGRVASLLALWPLWYAFYGGSEFEWEAMMFGGPGVLLGLLLWGWASYRCRHPRVCLEIDRQAGVARLHRGNDDPLECGLDELGAWTYTTWTTTRRDEHGQRTTTWHAAHCAGFGKHKLYVDRSQEACRSWASKIDAAARGLSERPGPRTIGELLAARFDAAIASINDTLATIGLTALTGLCAFASFRQLARTDGDELESAVVLALGFAVLTLGWRAVRGPAVAAGFAAVAGVAFAAKPWYAPIVREYMGELHRLSPSSETHLYYVIPGIGLVVLAAVMVSLIKVRSTARVHLTRSDPAKLDPPRLDPPKPPSP